MDEVDFLEMNPAVFFCEECEISWNGEYTDDSYVCPNCGKEGVCEG